MFSSKKPLTYFFTLPYKHCFLHFHSSSFLSLSIYLLSLHLLIVLDKQTISIPECPETGNNLLLLTKFKKKRIIFFKILMIFFPNPNGFSFLFYFFFGCCASRERFDEIGKRIKRESDVLNSQMGRRQMLNPNSSAGTLNTVTPCAACKLLRRRCAEECPFSPYFSPHEPQKFAAVHKVFGASNVSKLLSVHTYAKP